MFSDLSLGHDSLPTNSASNSSILHLTTLSDNNPAQEYEDQSNSDI